MTLITDINWFGLISFLILMELSRGTQWYNYVFLTFQAFTFGIYLLRRFYFKEDEIVENETIYMICMVVIIIICDYNLLVF